MSIIGLIRSKILPKQEQMAPWQLEFHRDIEIPLIPLLKVCNIEIPDRDALMNYAYRLMQSCAQVDQVRIVQRHLRAVVRLGYKLRRFTVDEVSDLLYSIESMTMQHLEAIVIPAN